MFIVSVGFGNFSISFSLRVTTTMAKWNSDKIILFLNIYETYPALYDKKNPDYCNRDKREKALREIIEKLGENGVMITESELRKKIKSIRQTFANELAKVRKSEETECGIGDIYIPKLIWFQTATFFAEHTHTSPRKLEETVQLQPGNRSGSETETSCAATDGLNGENLYDPTDNLADSDTEFIIPQTPQSNSSTRSSSAKRKCLEYIDNMQTMIDKLDKMQKLRNKEDSIDIFCKLLNKDMRELSPKNQLIFRQKVLDIMTRFKLEELGSNVEIVGLDYNV